MFKNNFFRDETVFTFISNRQWGNIDFRFDNRKETLKRRKKMVNFLDYRLNAIYEMDQVHGSKVEIIKTKSQKNIFPKTDALVTNLKNILLMVKTADCFPLLFFDSEKKVVAVCHAGWRGAIQKIFLKTLLAMINHFSCKITDIQIIIGPGARECCFKHHHFLQEKLPEWEKFIKNEEDDKTLDVSAFIKEELMAVGVKRKNIHDLKICTVCNKNYFSHFRSLRQNEPEGRFATIIGLKKNGD